jgi:anti-anti-sigma factor
MANPIFRFLRRKSDLSSGGTVGLEWSVLVPPTEIDLASEKELALLLETQWAPGTHLAIDLTGVSFLDSTAIHWFFSARERACQVGRELRLIAPEQGHVQRLLTIAGVAGVLPTYPSLEKVLGTEGKRHSQSPNRPSSQFGLSDG